MTMTHNGVSELPTFEHDMFDQEHPLDGMPSPITFEEIESGVRTEPTLTFAQLISASATRSSDEATEAWLAGREA